MPKPTHSYGYASFSQTGKVTMHKGKLPDQKVGQERVIGEAFAKHFDAEYRQLEERGHDFEMSHGSGGNIEVQQTEITLWDFLLPMTQVEYDEGPNPEIYNVGVDDSFAVEHVRRAERAGFSLAKPTIFAPARAGDRNVLIPTARPFRVDRAAREEALLKKICQKAKHYSKPAEGSRLWLLLWTVCSGFMPFWNQGGKSCVSEGVDAARAALTVDGSGPFDEIWFIQYIGFGMRPNRIWPPGG